MMILYLLCLLGFLTAALSSDTFSEESCQELGGTWSSVTNSCFKLDFHVFLTYEEAWTHCMESAPEGSRGRLPQFQSAEAFEAVSDQKYVWIAAYAPEKPAAKEFNAEEWTWEDRTADGSVVTSPMEWHTPEVSLRQRAQCMVIDYKGRFNDFKCERKEYPLCEYLTAGPAAEESGNPDFCNTPDVYYDHVTKGTYSTYGYFVEKPAEGGADHCVDSCLQDPDCAEGVFFPSNDKGDNNTMDKCFHASYKLLQDCQNKRISIEYCEPQCTVRVRACFSCEDEDKFQLPVTFHTFKCSGVPENMLDAFTCLSIENVCSQDSNDCSSFN